MSCWVVEMKVKINKQEKLFYNSNDKDKYVVHEKKFKQALNHRLKSE